jgi:hypothetical protein
VRPAATVSTAAQYSMNNWNFSTFSPCDVDRIFPLTVGDFLLRVSILTVCEVKFYECLPHWGSCYSRAVVLILSRYFGCDSHFTTRGLFGLHCFTCSYVSILCDWLLVLPLRVACCLWIFLLTRGHSPVSAALYGRCCCFVDRILLWLPLSMHHSVVSSRCGVC